MSSERTIGIRLVVDDQGLPRLKTFIQEAKAGLAEVVAQAGAAEKALQGVGAAAAGAAAGPKKLAQGFKDLDADIANALEKGTRRLANYEDAVTQALSRAESKVAAQGRLLRGGALQGAVTDFLNSRGQWDSGLLGQTTSLANMTEKAKGLLSQAGQVGRQAWEAVSQGAQKAWDVTKRVGSEISDLTGKVFSLRNAAVTLAAAWLFTHAASPGLKFNETMESAQLGIASLITSTHVLRDQTGQLLPLEARYAEAKRVSAQEMEKLRIAGLSTVATTEQLVEAYQQAVGPLTRAGVQLGDVQGLVVGIVQAAGALGMPMAQINEEVRSIAEGTINMHSRVAKTLGLSNEQLMTWRASGELVKELNKRLEVFKVFGEDAFNSWRGIKSNMGEALSYLMGKATEPLFNSLKAGWKGLLDQVFDIDLKAGKFDISPRFKPTITALQEMFSGLGSLVESGLRAVPDKISAITRWWQEHGESVKTVVSNTYKAVEAIISGALSVIEKTLGVLVPSDGRVKDTAAGVQSIADSIGAISGHLAKISTEKLLALAGLWGASKFLPAGGKAAAGAAAIGVLLAPDRPEDADDPFAYAQKRTARWQRQSARQEPPAPGSQAWMELQPTTAEPEVGGWGWRGGTGTLVASGDKYTQGQKDKLEDFALWYKGKLAELSALEAERTGDLPAKVRAEWDKAQSEIDKKLTDMKQAGLARAGEGEELKARLRTYYTAKEQEAENEKNVRLVQSQMEVGEATRTQLVEALEKKRADMAASGQAETADYHKVQAEINALRLGGLQHEEEMLGRRVELNQASNIDLLKLYQAHYQEVLKSDKLGLELKAKLLAEYGLKAQNLERAMSDQQLKVYELRAGFLRDHHLKKAVELARFTEEVKRMQITEVERAELIELKKADLQKSALQRALEQYEDFYANYEKLTEHTLNNIHDGIEKSFEAWLEGTETFGQSLVQSFKKIGLNAAAQFMTALATSLLAKGALALLPGLANLGGFGGGNLNVQLIPNGQGGFSLVQAASGAKSLYEAYNWFSGSSGLSTFGMPGGFGSSLFNWTGGTGDWASAFMTPEISGLSGLGYGVAGIGGALSGWQLASLLYGGKGYSTVGGAVGGAGGGIGGAMLGAPFGPIGMAIGGLAGGLLGGAGGGFLGSLFGGDDDTPDWEKPGKPQAHYDRLDEQLKAYLETLEEGTAAQGELNAKLEELAPLAAGAGDYLAGYGDIIGGTLEKLAGMTEGTEEYTRVVAEELNPAWIISAGLARDLADGMSLLDANKKAYNSTLETLLTSQELSEEHETSLIDLLISSSGSVADLTAKYDEYKGIKEQLAGAHDMERSKVEALVARGRELAKELGIQEGAYANLGKTVEGLNSAVEKFSKLIEALAQKKGINISISADMGGGDSYHTGGLVLHQGGWVDTALRRGLITPQGGRPVVLHQGAFADWPGLKYDEVMAKLRRREFVIREESVTAATLPWLAYVNDYGRLPQAEVDATLQGWPPALPYTGQDDYAQPPVWAVPVSMPAAGQPAQAGAVNITVHQEIHIHGDVIGDGEALERIQAAAQAGAEAAVLAALAARGNAGEETRVVTSLEAPI